MYSSCRDTYTYTTLSIGVGYIAVVEYTYKYGGGYYYIPYVLLLQFSSSTTTTYRLLLYTLRSTTATYPTSRIQHHIYK